MKLIYCPHCHDVVKLVHDVRNCQCEASWGCCQADAWHATYGGFAAPLGIENTSLVEAVTKQPEEGLGVRFEAFVISKSCPTFKKETP